MARKQIDYDLIEPGWRAGIKSPAQLAADYEKETGTPVSRVAIIKHFTGRGVSRTPPAERSPAVSAEDVGGGAGSETGFVYVLEMAEHPGLFKVGMAKSVSERLKAHQCSNPFELRVVCAYFTANMRVEEREIHRRFSDRRVRGEWYRLQRSDVLAIASRAYLGTDE